MPFKSKQQKSCVQSDEDEGRTKVDCKKWEKHTKKKNLQKKK